MFASARRAGGAAVLTVLAVVLAATTTIGLPGAASAAPSTASHQPAPAGAGHYTAAACNTTPTKRNTAQCFATVYTAVPGQIVPDAAAPPPSALSPAQIQDAYQLPSADAGQGQTVAIVDAFGDSRAEDDLAQFRAHYGLPPCTTANGCFSKVDQRGGTSFPADDAGWGLETSLDLDAVSAVCPRCDILLVEADDAGVDNLGAAVDTAVTLGAKFVSNSYGVPGESIDEMDFDAFYTHPGVAVTASTGDVGSLVNWPATNPNVIAVGGTTLTADSSARGWHEAAWAAGGSGCSFFEPKPDYQANVTTGCPRRAIADLSADGDPTTGLAVYDTLVQSGWLKVGGTSLSSPLIAAMYALAGTPIAGTFPVTYPYAAAPAHLFDVTAGSNGTCGTVLCNAGSGWDGPTGLGTPDGVAALTTGVQGEITGTVTDNLTGAPIAGATVSTPEGYTTRSDATGRYVLPVPAGTYDVTAQMFAFDAATVTGVAVGDGASSTVDFPLVAVPEHTVSGLVADGSGHGWPLYAKITISGYPGGAVYTDPFSGRYSVELPQGFSGNLHVTPILNGYLPVDRTVTIDGSDLVDDFAPTADMTTCSAPGYGFQFTGTGTTFTGWTGSTPRDGWTIVDNQHNGQVWRFDNPGGRTPPPGGDADFAILDSDFYGANTRQDAYLVSPVADLTGNANPVVEFDTYYQALFNSTADVDVSVDGVAWLNVWRSTTANASGHITVPVPLLANSPTAQVRFHYIGSFGWWWQVDNVVLGVRSCAPTTGGMVAGFVADGNTGQPLNGAKVSGTNGALGVSAPTPDDPALQDGFYELFSPGHTQLTASVGKYTPVHQNVPVARNAVTRQDFALRAGHLVISPGTLSFDKNMGATGSSTVTYTNNGTQPVNVDLAERAGAFTPEAQAGTPGGTAAAGAPLSLVKGTFSPAAMAGAAGTGSAAPAAQRTTTPYAPPWTDIADYPIAVVDNAAAYDAGDVYSVGGVSGSTITDKGYVYHPGDGQWDAIAPLPQPLEGPGAAFVDGILYTVGGWDTFVDPTTSVYAYDPLTNEWSQRAALPIAIAKATVTTLDNQIYVIGGCLNGACLPSSEDVFRFDPVTEVWTQLASYPTMVSYAACAGIAGEVVCAGGYDTTTGTTLDSTYIYNPGTDTWTAGASMPTDDWGAAVGSANDRLQVAGGIIDLDTTITNQAFEYDPTTNGWASLPNSNNTVYRAGGTCGLYKIGGTTSRGIAPVAFSEVLPGYDACTQDEDVPWLSSNRTSFTVGPGKTVTVRVAVDASQVAQPGGYAASLDVTTDSPYRYQPVSIVMTVNPPKSWGKITGTVTDAATGAAIPGVTVRINATLDGVPVGYTLKTDATGHYQLWLDARSSPLQVIVADDGYVPQAVKVKITRGDTATADFALAKAD